MSTPGLGPPSDASAVIVRAHLPGPLDRLRRRSIADPAHGVPAHLTLLYPFAAPDRLTAPVRGAIAKVAGRHQAFGYALARQARWPDTIYAAVDPREPFVALQSDLAATFPDFPIYGQAAGFEYVPHVSIAEGRALEDPTTHADPAWALLPQDAVATWIEVIARPGTGPWRTIWRITLGRVGSRARREP